jgi:hypothetical protein
MKRVILTVCDEERSVHRGVSFEVFDAVLASLGADPDTIEELESALPRYMELPAGRRFFADWEPGTGELSDSLRCAVIDLPGRLVVTSDLCNLRLEHDGEVQFVGGDKDKEIWLGFRIQEDWKLTEEMSGWERLAEDRRAERAANRPLDVRRVLYGKVCEFIASRCIAAVARGQQRNEAIPEIHANWLLEPREDLRNRAPRDWLLDRREFLECDLRDRCNQWSRLGECPPGLDQKSAAYRLGGFGPNEMVLYYDIVRCLLVRCWENVCKDQSADAEAEARRLENQMRVWMVTPHEDLQGFTAEEAIERERQRLPLAVSGEAAMADCDCPLCQMMAESGPVFWYLDEYHIDDGFAFSYYKTYEEWEREGGVRQPPEMVVLPPSSGKNASGATEVMLEGGTRGFWQSGGFPAGSVESVELGLFALGGMLAELLCDLKNTSPEIARPHLDSLNRDFSNLRETLRTAQAALIEPVMMSFHEHLEELGAHCPPLARQCAGLQSELLAALQRSLSGGCA